MSKHWNPRRTKSGWRVYDGGRTRRPSGFSWAELRLMLLGGIFAGLVAVQYSPAELPERSTAAASADDALTVTRPVRVIDGDTFDYAGMRIRIADIDTPEVNGRCPEETALAARATDRLEALLEEGPFELARTADGRDEDRYGRKLRIVTRDGASIGDDLVGEGLARSWSGRREPWCS